MTTELPHDPDLAQSARRSIWLDRPWQPAPGWPVGPPAVRWGIGAAIGCFLAAQILSAIWATIAVTAWGEGADSSQWPIWLIPVASLGLWAGYLFGPILVTRLAGRGPSLDLSTRMTRTDALVAVAVGVGAQLVAIPVLYWALGPIIDGDPSALARDLVERIDSGWDLAWFVLSVVVAAPVAEEAMFRGLLLPALARRVGPWGGAVVSATVFAIVHPDPVTYPGLALFGLILAWLTLRTGRLGAAIVAHAAFNLTTVVLLLL